ncbi:MAG: tRNA pseudouridine(38-40) synthase TruA [Rickettsiaceae bacterium]
MKYRYKIIIEYLSINYSGWQRQLNTLSIQELLENAIYQFSGQNVTLKAAGRTDSGVHALGQVAHFDLPKYYEPNKVTNAINHFLRPHTVGVIKTYIVNEDFHARFKAVQRHYCYKIINQKHIAVIQRDRAWWIRDNLDVNAMKRASNHLVGKYDFTSFRASDCQAKSPIRSISSINIIQNDNNIEIYISARSFLYKMVRNIVGSLVLVGRGKWDPDDLLSVLLKKDRKFAGMTAPAYGLYFLKVDY